MAGSSVFGYVESDSDDEMPPGWEERTTLDGRVYYANHAEKATQWTHPRTSKKKVLVGDLPPGWEKTSLDDGRVVFVNHADKKTTFTDPRLAFAVEDKRNSGPRQKFDSSTKALQILHGTDLSNKTVLITGGNCGIGYETARSLALHNAHVVIACRDVNQGNKAVNHIKQFKDDARLDVLQCDLSDLKSVRRCAQQFINNQWPLHILILNAAVFAVPYSKTADTDLELNFAVNHLGHFYLTKLLCETLEKSAPARIVIVSSESHRQTQLFQNFNSPPSSIEELSPSKSSSYWYLHAYNLSKLCNIWFAFELNRRFYARKITVNALHPGNMVNSGLSRHSCFMRTLFTIVRPFAKSLEQAAATTVLCATSPDLEGIGGHYFNNCWFCDPSPLAKETAFQAKLWEISDSIIDRFEAVKS